MTTVYSTPILAEALQIASMLQANGIETNIPDDVTASIAPHHLLHSGGVQVQVSEENAAKAMDLIGQTRAAE